MVFIQFAQICLCLTILYNMKKYKPLENIHNKTDISVHIIKNKNNNDWKLLLDSPFSETGW